MKPMNRLKQILINSKSSFERFPLPIFISILAAIFFICGIYPEKLNEKFIRYGLISIFSVFLYLNIKLFSEGIQYSAKDESDKKKNKLFIISCYIISLPIVYAMSVVINLFKDGFKYDSAHVYFGVLFALFICVFFISKIFYHNDYIAYAVNIYKNIIISFSYSIILFIGLSAIILTINLLLNAKISSKFYFYIFIVIFIPFNFLIFLSQLPKIQNPLNDYKFGSVFEKLIDFIVIPLCSIYAIILYIYFIKIIFTREVPQNIISNLVVWYSFVCVGVLFINKIIETDISQSFKKIMPIIILPLILFMFYSMCIRVSEYGLTPNRYYVIAGGIFSLLSMLYYIFYKDSSNITIPIILVIVILISTIGPQSAYNISLLSQEARLYKILDKNKMLKGEIITPNKNLSEDDKKQILDITNYLNYRYQKSQLKYLGDGTKSFKQIFGFDIGDLNLSSEDEKAVSDMDNAYISATSLSEIDVSNYKTFTEIDTGQDQSENKNDKYTYKFEDNKCKILYKKGKDFYPLLEINLKEIKDKLIVLKEENSNINIDYLTIEGSKDNINYKVIFRDVFFNSMDDLKDFYLHLYLLTSE